MVLGLLAWPGVEICRYFAVTRELTAALAREDAINEKLARAKASAMAKRPNAAQSQPVSNPAPGQPSAASRL